METIFRSLGWMTLIEEKCWVQFLAGTGAHYTIASFIFINLVSQGGGQKSVYTKICCLHPIPSIHNSEIIQQGSTMHKTPYWALKGIKRRNVEPAFWVQGSCHLAGEVIYKNVKWLRNCAQPSKVKGWPRGQPRLLWPCLSSPRGVVVAVDLRLGSRPHTLLTQAGQRAGTAPDLSPGVVCAVLKCHSLSYGPEQCLGCHAFVHALRKYVLGICSVPSTVLGKNKIVTAKDTSLKNVT
jgi:hypothetical protein